MMTKHVFPRYTVRGADEHAVIDHLAVEHNRPDLATHAWAVDEHNHLHQISRGIAHTHADGFYDINGVKVEVGAHLCIVDMPNDPDPLPAGSTCVVNNIVEDPYDRGLAQLWVTWDPPHERRTLNLVEADRFVILVD